MKRGILLALSCGLLVGCGATEDTPLTPTVDTSAPTVESVLESGTTQQEVEVTAPEDTEVTPIDVPEGYGSYGTADLDLSYMSSTMVYTQVYNMMMTPEDFAGYTIKVNGIFAYYYDELWDEYYYAVIVMDATECCAQGIEFSLSDEDLRDFPGDYPEAGDAVTVVGVYNRFYAEEYPDWEYYRLEQAEFITA